MKEFVVYTLSRLGLFVVSYLLVVGVYLLATGGDPVPLFWPFLLAIVVSSIASVYLLKGQRQRFAAVIERRAAAASERLERSRAKEDEPDS
ncbi:MAG TPA: DUF4229 domain-containing protein [Nocardioidaceae bacterium]|nr:DUF4229 domain-containing protein [Methylomirabilota bacterium]HSE70268.1 DUF4229 domain-containing protein [Nocardioidaceae bacterium]